MLVSKVVNAGWCIPCRTSSTRHQDNSTVHCDEQVYKQKVKHLLYEHQNTVAVLKADGEMAVRAAGVEAATREAALGRDVRALRQQLKEQVLNQSLAKTV